MARLSVPFSRVWIRIASGTLKIVLIYICLKVLLKVRNRQLVSQLLILSGLGRVDIGRRDVPGLSFIVQLLERARMGSYGLALVAHTHTHTPLPVTIKICPKNAIFRILHLSLKVSSQTSKKGKLISGLTRIKEPSDFLGQLGPAAI